MYIKNRFSQLKFSDFQQPLGLKMNPENRWIKKAAIIPWDEIEKRYAKLFPSKTGNPAKPLRMALGSILIQKQYNYSDRELIDQITENPYYQYFIGLPGYQMEEPFAPSLLVEFRKRLTEEILMEINEMVIEYNDRHSDEPGKKNKGPKEEETSISNSGTLMLDATCAPQHIAFPQDINLLNEAREKLEKIIDTICEENGLKKPRTYRKIARKKYLDLAKCKKRTKKKIRRGIRSQLQFIRRDLNYIDDYLSKGLTISKKIFDQLTVIRELYEQQQTMYETKKNSIPNRIVNISLPFIRPIVRGKAKAETEFGAKIDMSIDEKGMARLEKLSFDSYNECDVLIGAAEKYYERYGHYPERILADMIYRTQKNLKFCKLHGIRLSGPPLGRPKRDPSVDKKIEYQDSVDRIEVERGFSLAKRSFGLGCIWTKLAETTKCSIAMSLLAMNIHRLLAIYFCHFSLILESFRHFSEWLSVRKTHWFSLISKMFVRSESRTIFYSTTVPC